MADHHCRAGGKEFEVLQNVPDAERNSLAYVTFGQKEGRENCVEVDPDHAVTLFYRDQVCRNGRSEYEEFMSHKPTTWQPKCIIALIEAESRAKLRDELVEAGRVLTDPLQVTFNFTTALGAEPNLEVTAMNCALGHLLQETYEADLVGQAVYTELSEKIAELAQVREQYDFFVRVYSGLPAYRPPAPPPPPPPKPPPANLDGPPAPPQAPEVLTFLDRIEKFKDDISALEYRITTINAQLGTCVPSATNTCGRDAASAPNPWIAENGEPCIGYATQESFEGAFCGYWGADSVNLDAATQAEAIALMSEDGAPWCYSSNVTVLKCSTLADRTTRSGIYELEEWKRLDRPYCSNEVFRQLVLDNSSVTEAECRLSIEERLSHCQVELCPPCQTPCNYPWAKAVADVLKCFRSDKHFGYLHYYMVSDAGQLALSMHGAVRSTGYGPVPEKLSKHLYGIAHNNPSGLLQRDSVSCRLEHRNSPMPHLTAGFDESGNPVARSGFMMPCRKHSDCYPCGRHPLTGQVRANPFLPSLRIGNSHTHYCSFRSSSNARRSTPSTIPCARQTTTRRRRAASRS